KYSYLKYLRTVTLATKGQEDETLQELPIYLINDIVLIDEFRRPIDDQHTYYLVYLDEENKIKKIKANQYKKTHVFYFTREQLENDGVLHNKKIKQLRYNNAGNEITVVCDLSIIIVK
ncbi:MAG: hypothetical protein KBT06_07930, partial [Prevotellaceae bacterium]|nr:hypothetical protein [Candidatus Colivivens equi]